MTRQVIHLRSHEGARHIPCGAHSYRALETTSDLDKVNCKRCWKTILRWQKWYKAEMAYKNSIRAAMSLIDAEEAGK